MILSQIHRDSKKPCLKRDRLSLTQARQGATRCLKRLEKRALAEVIGVIRLKGVAADQSVYSLLMPPDQLAEGMVIALEKGSTQLVVAQHIGRHGLQDLKMDFASSGPRNINHGDRIPHMVEDPLIARKLSPIMLEDTPRANEYVEFNVIGVCNYANANCPHRAHGKDCKKC
jgi:hypothetical protein